MSSTQHSTLTVRCIKTIFLGKLGRGPLLRAATGNQGLTRAAPSPVVPRVGTPGIEVSNFEEVLFLQYSACAPTRALNLLKVPPLIAEMPECHQIH